MVGAELHCLWQERLHRDFLDSLTQKRDLSPHLFFSLDLSQDTLCDSGFSYTGNMASDGMKHITGAFAALTILDGAVPTDLKLGDKTSQRAHITQLTTSFEVVWYKPHRNVWLRYTSRQNAEQAIRALEGVTTGKLKLHCVLKEPARAIDTNFSVQICNVTDDITWDQISGRLPAVDNVQRHAFGKFTYPLDTNVEQAVKEKIEHMTGLKVRKWAAVATDNGLKSKAIFSLKEPDTDLGPHATALNGSMLDDIPGLRIFVAEHLRLYLGIRKDAFDRRTKALKGLAQRAWKEHKIRVKIYDGELTISSPGHCRLLCLEGIGRKAFQRIKAEIDDCLITDIALGIQRANFTNGGEHLERRVIKLHTIAEYKVATQGGVKRLEEYFGRGNVKFQDDTDVPSITIKSKREQWELASQILAGAPTNPGTTCDICIGDDSPLVTIPSCAHSVCRRCLTDYCSIDAGDKIPLRCFAAPGCESLLPIEWLADKLPQPAFKTLLGRVVDAHCQSHPAAYVCCSGEDCEQYLTRGWQSDRIICPSCLLVNCTKCKTLYHYGEACEEFTERTDPHNEALSRHLAEAGGKRCPRCQTPSIKEEGCNHIICTGCRVHYCWLCLETFNGEGGAYRHLDEVHGGNGLDDEEQEAILHNIVEEARRDALGLLLDAALAGRRAGGAADQ